MGFTLRSLYLPAGIQAFPSGRTHLPFHLPLFPSAEAPDRPDRPRFLGFIPAGSSGRPTMGLAPPLPKAPLGFALPGLVRKGLDQDFARSPLTRFIDRAANGSADRRPRVSIGPRLGSSAPRGFPQDGGTSNPLRVCAPAESSTCERTFTRAMSSPRAATNVTAVCPTLLR